MYNSFNYQLIRVNGIEEAKTYRTLPNSTVALFDTNEDLFYLKTTDISGFEHIRTFKFEEITSNDSPYVTRKEFEELKELIKNGK